MTISLSFEMQWLPHGGSRQSVHWTRRNTPCYIVVYLKSVEYASAETDHSRIKQRAQSFIVRGNVIIGVLLLKHHDDLHVARRAATRERTSACQATGHRPEKDGEDSHAPNKIPIHR